MTPRVLVKILMWCTALSAALIVGLVITAGPTKAEEIERDEDGSIHRSSSVLTAFQNTIPCPATNSQHGECHGYIKDHIRPLCAGGEDAVHNLKWSEIGYAKLRDKQEWHLCRILKKAEGRVGLNEDPTTMCSIIENEHLELVKDACNK